MKATHWSIEAPLQQENAMLNNLSVVRSRHVPLTRGGRIKGLGAIVIDERRRPRSLSAG
jgi:hypothetical protein